MDEVLAFYGRHEVALLIAMLGLVTLATRAAGYLVLARFQRIPAPVQAGLEAVPAAVITTLVLPPALTAGPAEMIAMIAAGLACLRLPPVAVIALGIGLLVMLRQLGL
ncbi:AzlD family protein [Salaquimonas pukyongi]|uniref:AzlD family protein n=1 Tax=Salaquimonas pukyongi TaxID=2712698 RepID=UPI00096B7262|nr:AzlD domain-containing protein [Salaquimonas pukyongi]